MPRARGGLALGKKKGNNNKQQVRSKEAREAAARAAEEAEAKAKADARHAAAYLRVKRFRERRRQSREAPAAAPSADPEWETDCEEDVPEEDQGAPGPSVRPQTAAARKRQRSRDSRKVNELLNAAGGARPSDPKRRAAAMKSVAENPSAQAIAMGVYGGVSPDTAKLGAKIMENAKAAFEGSAGQKDDGRQRLLTAFMGVAQDGRTPPKPGAAAQHAAKRKEREDEKARDAGRQPSPRRSPSEDVPGAAGSPVKPTHLARRLGISKTRGAVVAYHARQLRRKLNKGEKAAILLDMSRRRISGRKIKEEVVQAVHEFLTNHRHVRPSPNQKDTLLSDDQDDIMDALAERADAVDDGESA